MLNHHALLFASLLVAHMGSGATAVSEQDAAYATEGFSILISTRGGELRARCESGCRWDTLSALYPGSSYRIDEAGVHPLSPSSSAVPSPKTTSGFLFTVHASAGRINATCEEGCSWKTVQGASENGMYRIDAAGIEIR